MGDGLSNYLGLTLDIISKFTYYHKLSHHMEFPSQKKSLKHE